MQDYQKLFESPQGQGLLRAAGLRTPGGFKSFKELSEMQGVPAWEMLLQFTDQVVLFINGDEEALQPEHADPVEGRGHDLSVLELRFSVGKAISEHVNGQLTGVEA